MVKQQELPIYLINLDRSPDRLEFMAGQLDALGLNWERFTALDAETATDEEIGKEVQLSGQTLRMLRGSQCCAVSNFEVWRKFVETGAPAAIILQDDVFLSSDFSKFAENADWVPKNCGLVQLEKWGKHETKKLLGAVIDGSPVGGRVIQKLYSRTGGAGAYLITREAAIWALENKGMTHFAIDHVLFNMNMSPVSRKLGVAVINPFIAIQGKDEFESKITGTKGDKKTLRQKLVRIWYEVNLMPSQLWVMLTGRAKWSPVNYKEIVDVKT